MTAFNAAFWKWFKGSEVVDDDGKPLVVYHGTRDPVTRRRFDECSFRQCGIYFSADRDYALKYAEIRSGGKAVYVQLIAAFVAIRRPLVLNLPDEFGYEGAIVDGDRIIGFYRELTREVIEQLKRLGYDGIVVNITSKALPSGRIPVNPFEVVAFAPSQIKLAEGNDGTWDEDDDDIRSNPPAKWRSQPIRVDAKVFRLGDVMGGKLYHGTTAKLHAGDVLVGGKHRNFRESSESDVSITSDLERAHYWARQVAERSGGMPVVYEVKPMDEVSVWRVGLASYGSSFTLWEGRTAKAVVVRPAAFVPSDRVLAAEAARIIRKLERRR